METLAQTVATFAENSFPVVVAAYLLIRMEKQLTELRMAIAELARQLEPRD